MLAGHQVVARPNCFSSLRVKCSIIEPWVPGSFYPAECRQLQLTNLILDSSTMEGHGKAGRDSVPLESNPGFCGLGVFMRRALPRLGLRESLGFQSVSGPRKPRDKQHLNPFRTRRSSFK